MVTKCFNIKFIKLLLKTHKFMFVYELQVIPMKRVLPFLRKLVTARKDFGNNNNQI